MKRALLIASLVFAPGTAAAYECGNGEESPLAHVVVRGDGHTTLYRQQQGTAPAKVCEAPCEADVPLCDVYSVGGNGIKTTQLVLHAAPGDTVVISNDRGGEAAKTTGYVLLGTGIVGVGASVVMVYVALFQAVLRKDTETTGTALKYTFTGSVALAALGGLVLLLSQGANDISQERHPAGPPKDAFVRIPELRADEPRAPAAQFPLLFTTHF